MEDNFDKKMCYYCVRSGAHSLLVTESMKKKRFTEHMRTLTNFADSSFLANMQAEEVFATRVL